MREYLFAPDDPEAVLAKLTDSATRIVSLTVTEGGYNFHAVTGEFDVNDPGVLHDLTPGVAPTTTFGLVVVALVRRRARCAPVHHRLLRQHFRNGDVARRSFTAFAALREDDLAEWMRREVHFPNSMVDRITPVTTDADRAEVATRFGVDDQWPVMCEPYTQWVLQDSFGAGRPPLQDVGVQLVADVEPYELMKLRLLNASHQALCYFGYLAGYRLVHEVCQDPLFASFLLAYMDREGTPTLEPVPGVDLEHYKRELLQRFSNPQVRDTVARLCAESSDRIPKWLLPVIRHNLASGGRIELAAAVVASWARYAEGVDEQGEPIEVVDRLREPLMAAAARSAQDPLAFLQRREVFGDLIDEPRFTSAYTVVLASLHDRGARATLEDLVARLA